MAAALQWVVALLVIAVVGAGATVIVRTQLMRRDETAAGIVALSGISWRQFVHLVLEMLARRGYARVHDREAPADDGDFTLAHGEQRYLLSCKHGSAFVLGNTAVNELASDIRLRNADGGLLVTQGRIAPEARAPAKLQHIELLDGPTLWPELRELIPPEQLSEITAGAATRARQRTLFAWLIALVAGILVFFLMPAPEAEDAAGGTTVMPAARAPAPAAAASGSPATPAADATVPAADDAATQAKQREDVAKAIATLPMVDRAVWSTASTLQVFLSTTEGDPVAAICPLVMRYEGLTASRIQLTPPQGSDAPVRFRQCRSY